VSDSGEKSQDHGDVNVGCESHADNADDDQDDGGQNQLSDRHSVEQDAGWYQKENRPVKECPSKVAEASRAIQPQQRHEVTLHGLGAEQRHLNETVEEATWFACTWNRPANSASVPSPRIAAKATFALNDDANFRRFFAMNSPPTALIGP
jgi:hypothetical protein